VRFQGGTAKEDPNFFLFFVARDHPTDLRREAVQLSLQESRIGNSTLRGFLAGGKLLATSVSTSSAQVFVQEIDTLGRGCTSTRK
jgi:hypothetical protein